MLKMIVVGTAGELIIGLCCRLRGAGPVGGRGLPLEGGQLLYLGLGVQHAYPEVVEGGGGEALPRYVLRQGLNHPGLLRILKMNIGILTITF